MIEFVNEIDKKEFFGQLSRNVPPAFESVDAPAKIKRAVTFLVVDNAFVVKLGGPQTKLVVQIRRGHNKTIGLEKSLKQFALAGRNFPKCELFRIVVKTMSQFLEITCIEKRLQMTVDRGRPKREIFAAIDSSPTQMLQQNIEIAKEMSVSPTSVKRDLLTLQK